MKRLRKSSQSPRGLAPDIVARALQLLQTEYIAILDGSAGDDSKKIALRVAAAGELLQQMALLAELAGSGVDPAQAVEEVLAQARATMSHENKT